jgi:hypothetical protein
MDKRDKTHINIMNSLNKDGGNSVTDIDIGFTEKYRIFVDQIPTIFQRKP